jgi:hypothetical protein
MDTRDPHPHSKRQRLRQQEPRWVTLVILRVFTTLVAGTGEGFFIGSYLWYLQNCRDSYNPPQECDYEWENNPEADVLGITGVSTYTFL